MEQIDIFDPHKQTHRGDPLASHEAVMKALANAKGLSLAILEELGKVFPEGLSDEQLAERLGVISSVSGNDVAKRRSSLKQKGLVEACRETGENSKGNKVTLWKLVYPPKSKVSRWEP